MSAGADVDVYKRQLLSLVLVVCMLAACGPNNSGTSNTGNNSGTTNNQTSDTGDTSTGADTTTLRIGLHGDTGGFDPQTGTSGTPPVSYTHLDVYKRQAHSRDPRP